MFLFSQRSAILDFKYVQTLRLLNWLVTGDSCLSTVCLAAAFPDLELFINLSGAIFLSTLGLLTPAIIDTVHKWDRGLGAYNWILWKNIFIAFISLLALFAGSFVSIKSMIEKFEGVEMMEVAANVTSVSGNVTMGVWRCSSLELLSSSMVKIF